ncbi:UNVERIFIED_CONTAM: hypothetical protein GTU68_027471 [Idotea baltica]|nr:hypothetical protein [Idotea baltica]
MAFFQKQFLHPRFWLSWLGLALLRLSIYLPVRVQIFTGRLVDLILSPFTTARRRVAQRNIELCFPELSEQQQTMLVDENMRTMGMMLIETALSWWASDKSLEKRVRYEGLEHLDAALEKGKGVILLTGHFTSMELGGRLIMLKKPCYVMFRPLKNLLFNAVMLQQRTYHCEGIVLQEEPRAMIRALRKNKIVWYAPDQDYGRKLSIFAKFFGNTAATVPATARMVKLSGAAVVPFVPRREADGTYTLTLKPALNDFPTGDDVVDAQTINDLIEKEIRQSPAQYYWVHRRFKTQPDGTKATLYKDIN